MIARRPTFGEGERVRFGASTVAVQRTRFNASGREWVDVRYVGGIESGLVTTVAVENLRRVERPRMAPAAPPGGALA